MIDLEVMHRIQATLLERPQRLAHGQAIVGLIGEAEDRVAFAREGDRLHLVREVTDLWFHSMILLAQFGIGVDDVMVEFRRREGISGIDEKNSRSPE